jgi:hypothetical protein
MRARWRSAGPRPLSCGFGDGIAQGTAAQRVGWAASEGKYGKVGLICLRQLLVALAFVDTRRRWQFASYNRLNTFKLVIIYR